MADPSKIVGGLRKALEAAAAPMKAAKEAEALRVFQGSPHRMAPAEGSPYGRLDSSKIGTGEGGQAYGHGHYMAQAKDVAKTYRPRSPLHEEKLIKEYNRAQAKSNYPKMEVLEDAMLHKPPDEIVAKYSNLDDGYTPDHAKAAAEYAQWFEKNKPEVGGLYHIDLPSEHINNMLDWDKPMKQHSKHIKDALDDWQWSQIEAGAQKRNMSPYDYEKEISQSRDYPPNTGGGISGEEYYSALASYAGGQDKASKILQELNIPGIKYYDEASRPAAGWEVGKSGKGTWELKNHQLSRNQWKEFPTEEEAIAAQNAIPDTGTRNFVVFPGNEGIAKIVDREKKGGVIHMADGGKITGGLRKALEAATARGGIRMAAGGDSIKPTPRHKGLGAAADVVNFLHRAASKPFGYDNPPVEMLSELLGVPAVGRTLDRMSYGEPLTNYGKANKPLLPDDIADATMSVAPLVGPLSKMATKGAKVVGKGALDLAKSDAAYNLAQKAFASPALAAARPMGVVKEPGGNWLGGVNSPESKLAEMKPRVTTAQLAAYTPEQAAEQIASGRIARNDALSNWVDRNLTNYVKKQMGTVDDPVRKLAEEGIIHMPTREVGINRYRAPTARATAQYKQAGQSEAAKAWEDASDVSIKQRSVQDLTDPVYQKQGNVNANIYQAEQNKKEFPWLEKLAPESKVYSMGENFNPSNLGFDHILDVLKEDVAAGRIRPDQLSKVSMEQAVRRTHEYDQEMAKKMREAQIKATEGMPVHKEYPGGYKWIELKSGDDAKTTADALKYEGDTMGHCVGNYCPDVMEGKSRIYSLRDAKGEPHVTVEVKPQTDAGWGDFKKAGSDALSAQEEAKQRMGSNYENLAAHYVRGMSPEERTKANDELSRHMTDIYKERHGELPKSIQQIKGKQNREPHEQYLPYVQDFVRSGKWSDVGDLKNAKLYRKGDFIDEATPDQLDAIGMGEYLTADDIKKMRQGKPPQAPRFIDTDPEMDLDINLPDRANGEPRMANGGKIVGGLRKALAAAAKAEEKPLQGNLIEKILEAQQPPMTTPMGTGLPLMPRDKGMYTPRQQKELPRMVEVDKARAANKSPKYNERMQDLLDSPTARKKVDKLIDKGQALNIKEWYGTEPLRQVAMDLGRTPEQFESMLAQLASASQRNPVDKQNQMGSYLYHLSETGQLPENSLLLTNKLKKALKEDPSLAEGRQLVELPQGYGSLAQGDIFNRAVMIGQGNIGKALPPEKKLGTFYENLLGNLKPVTVDVNALRGPIIERGDPRWLTSKLVEKDDTGKVINTYKPREMYASGELSMREARQRPGFWEAAPSGSEYAGFEDLWTRGAKRHGVEPAEAQALGWYGSGVAGEGQHVTALKTKPELYVDNLERLIKKTAEQTGKSPTEVMNDMITGQGFLRKDGGAVTDPHKSFEEHRIRTGHEWVGKEVKKADGGLAFKTLDFKSAGGMAVC